MRGAGFLGCLLLIASYGFHRSFQIGLQVPLHFDSEEKSENTENSQWNSSPLVPEVDEIPF